MTTQTGSNQLSGVSNSLKQSKYWLAQPDQDLTYMMSDFGEIREREAS